MARKLRTFGPRLEAIKAQLHEYVARVQPDDYSYALMLTAREWRVLSDHFGLFGRPAMTLKAIGDGLGLSRERTRQTEARAVRKLAQPERQEALRNGEVLGTRESHIAFLKSLGAGEGFEDEM